MSRTVLTAIAAAGLIAMVPQVTQAGCGGGGYGGSYGGGYGTTSVNRHYTPVYHSPVVVHKPLVVHRPVYVAPPVADHCTHPNHCHVWVRPGESLDAICLREYGNPGLWRQVAEYNGCSHLEVGQQLLLPSIYSSGRMIPSSAPAPVAIVPTAPAAIAMTPPVAPAS